MAKTITEKIFKQQDQDGCWKKIGPSHKYYPSCLHYIPNFKASLWVLIQLADMQIDPDEERINKPLSIILNHFYDSKTGIFSLGKDHFPIPCLNGNLIYLDGYFNGKLSQHSLQALDFFSKYQRFDDGQYLTEKNIYCKNKSCFGPHSCYWGIVKLLKGLSFVPHTQRTTEMKKLVKNSIDFILIHQVCYSSKNPDKIMINKMDLLTFPNMYKSDFLEILWILMREKVVSSKMAQALELLKSKQTPEGQWQLERRINNPIASVGATDRPNPFVTKRAKEVLDSYKNRNS